MFKILVCFIMIAFNLKNKVIFFLLILYIFHFLLFFQIIIWTYKSSFIHGLLWVNYEP